MIDFARILEIRSVSGQAFCSFTALHAEKLKMCGKGTETT
jgi:hypothetical protein